MPVNLLNPVLSNRTKSINFFNGRLLAGEDLTTEQQTNRFAHSLLGQAIGDGVVYGLDVTVSTQSSTVSSPVMAVTQGLAINKNGGALLLDTNTEVALVRPPSNGSAGTGSSSIFEDCTPVQTGTYIAGAGVYLLTVGPATATQGLAEVSGVSTATARCNSNYKVQGVQFRLISLNLTTDELKDVNHLRNLVAYKCFGFTKQSNSQAAFVADPFNTPMTSYGLMDDLRSSQVLTNCEVPLAVLYWTADAGVVFVDTWAVRRSVFPQAASAMWTPLSGRRRVAEGLAMFLQFQEQINDMIEFGVGGAALGSVAVTDQFRAVPAAGLVPIQGVSSPLGFDTTTFFGNFPSGQPTVITASELNRLIHDSWLYAPVDLTNRAMLQLYQLEANIQAVAQNQATQLYILYVSREMLGFVEHDSVASTFAQAWEVYRGLVNKRVFLPSDVTSDAIGARLAILSVEQDVMAVANQKTAVAASRSMNFQDALDAFTDLYNVQHDLVVLFASPIPGITDLQGRDSFTQTLNTYLEKSGPGTVPALNPSLQKGDLQGAIAAQEAINNFVGSWTGEGVAIGYIDVQYKSSPMGKDIVPGDPAYPQIFTITNFTDRTLTIGLGASVSAAHGDWSKSVQFQDSTGKQIASVTLVSTASQDVTVAVTVPKTAQIGDVATLDFTASAQPPNQQTGTIQLLMNVSATSGPPIVHSVKFTQVSLPAADATNASPNQIFAYGFSVRYSATQPPNTENFIFTVGLVANPASTAGDWFVDFGGAPSNKNTSPSGEIFYTTTVSLTSGAPTDTTVTVRVRAPASRIAQDQVASLFISIDSTDLPDHASDQPAGEPFTITLKHL